MTFWMGRTRVTVEFWFFLVVMLFLLGDKTGSASLMLLTVVFHECGHLLVLFLLGVPISALTLAPYGVKIERGSTFSLSKLQESAIYAAGPFLNLLLFFLVLAFAPRRFLWELFGAMNLVAALFNLLPIASLDGGNLVRVWLWGRGSAKQAALLSTAISAAVLIPLFGLAFFLLLRGGNFTLLLTCVYLALLVAMG